MEKKKLKKLTLKKDVVAELNHNEMSYKRGGSYDIACYSLEHPTCPSIDICVTDLCTQLDNTCVSCDGSCGGQNTCSPLECAGGGATGLYECGVTTTFSVGCYY